MTIKKMDKREKEWQTREDANTLARYQEIMNSPSRLRAATTEARKQAKELNTRATMLEKAAGSRKGK